MNNIARRNAGILRRLMNKIPAGLLKVKYIMQVIGSIIKYQVEKFQIYAFIQDRGLILPKCGIIYTVFLVKGSI